MKVSIITVCYNSEQFISTAIDSVLAQSHVDIEYIIVDGNSKDRTVSIIQSYSEGIYKIVSEDDKGIYDAMNKGVSLASGDIIAILNSDDFYLHDNVISQVVQSFSDNPHVAMVFGNVDFVKAGDVSVPTRFYSSFNFEPWKLRFGFMPAHPAAFIKKSVYEKVGLYSLDYESAADFEWFIRALKIRGLPYIKLNQTLVRMREGGISSAGIESYWRTSKEQYLALRNNEVYSNLLFLLTRLPIKFLQKISMKKISKDIRN